MTTAQRRDRFLADLLTVGGAGEAYSILLQRRDGMSLGGYARPALADLVKKHFPDAAGRKTKKPRAGQRRRKNRKAK